MRLYYGERRFKTMKGETMNAACVPIYIYVLFIDSLLITISYQGRAFKKKREIELQLKTIDGVERERRQELFVTKAKCGAYSWRNKKEYAVKKYIYKAFKLGMSFHKFILNTTERKYSN